MRGKSKQRLEMGEEAWVERKKKQNREKTLRCLRQNPSARKRQKNYSTYWRIRKKKELLDYKGGRCEICGYEKDILGAYDFHHVDPQTKEFSISNYQVLNIEKMKKEVDKCLLVCRNCHAELHDKENRHIRDEAFAVHNSYLKTVEKNKFVCECGETFSKKRANQRFCSVECKKRFTKKDEPIVEKFCKCGGKFNGRKRRKYCSQKCAKFFTRKVKRPSRSQLVLDIKNCTWKDVGGKYGVSDNAVRKWAKQYGLA